MKSPSLASVSVGIASLRVNPLRTVLSTLGIVVGVGALVSVVALGDGVEQFARSQLERTTSLQVFTVNSITSETVDGLRVDKTAPATLEWDDAVEIANLLGDADVVLSRTRTARIGGADATPRAARVTATTPGWTSPEAPSLQAGRLLAFQDLADSARVAVVSRSLAATIAEVPEQAIGSSVTIDGATVAVVGVLEGPDSSAHAALIPLTSIELDAPPGLTVRAPTVESVEPLRDSVEAWLASRFGAVEGNFVVQSQRGRLEQTRRAITIFTILMGSIAGISVLVGGIGIMNILLASVVERTREIGIRKSIGARRVDILAQFLSESVAVSGFGSLLGVALGWTIASLAAAFMRAQAEAQVAPAFTMTTVLVAVGAALGVGIVFGTYPAVRASRLSPIDAIRHE